MPVLANNLLILGGPSTGKTTFGAQLLGRFRLPNSVVRLRNTPADISLFMSALDRLAQGMSPEHTPASSNQEIVMPIQFDNGQQSDLIWPDYGGEQIINIVHSRMVSDIWFQRIENSTGWILFVRPSQLIYFDDFLSRDTRITNQTFDVGSSSDLSSNALLIELLQMLLYLKGIGISQQINSPKLSIFITCWDEIVDVDLFDNPAQVLQNYLPLLSEFVATNWIKDSFSVWGLSSQERPLETNTPDESYVDNGPEAFGYVVSPTGEKSSDLTMPIMHLLRQL